jgi:hypothetical protein
MGRRPSSTKQNKTLADALLEVMIGEEVFGLSSVSRGFCVACVGPTARSTLAEALDCSASVGILVTYLYGRLILF